MRKITFSDLDGTYRQHEEIRGEVEGIVTGRSWDDSRNIDDDVRRIPVPIFFNPDPDTTPTLESIVAHKSFVINSAQVTKFYEDQKEQVNLLKILCPSCEIVWINNKSGTGTDD